MSEHVPVLLAEILAGLAITPGADCIDGTVGSGGHAEAILQASAPTGRLLGLDADPAALVRAQARLATFGARVTLVQANFRELRRIATEHDFAAVHAVLLDLGISSPQLAEASRGFSFQESGPLDMRLDPRSTLTAAEIVNEWPQEELAQIIARYGEEPHARRIARAIVAARPLQTTTELAAVVSKAVGSYQNRKAPASRRWHIHPATRTFQALRIAVNDELGALEEALSQATALLRPHGRLAVIAFHSLEDRIVKRFMQREARDCLCPADFPVCRCGHRATLMIVTRKPIQPAPDEIDRNPRSRSAKLRIAERL